jgi:hypothetical protein
MRRQQRRQLEQLGCACNEQRLSGERRLHRDDRWNGGR